MSSIKYGIIDTAHGHRFILNNGCYRGNPTTAEDFSDIKTIFMHLMTYLLEHPGSYLPGASGQLTADQFGRVSRVLTWAKFQNGLARPLGGSLDVQDQPAPAGSAPAPASSAAQPAAAVPAG